MKKTNTSKLNLNRETLRQLDNNVLTDVHGGSDPIGDLPRTSHVGRSACPECTPSLTCPSALSTC